MGQRDPYAMTTTVGRVGLWERNIKIKINQKHRYLHGKDETLFAQLIYSLCFYKYLPLFLL